MKKKSLDDDPELLAELRAICQRMHKEFRADQVKQAALTVNQSVSKSKGVVTKNQSTSPRSRKGTARNMGLEVIG